MIKRCQLVVARSGFLVASFSAVMGIICENVLHTAVY